MIAWVTGAGGLIGSYLLKKAGEFAGRFQPRGLTRQDLDLTDFKAVEELFAREKPSLIIHCAAMSRTPDCAIDPELARGINVEVTRHLASLAREIGFIFFSTDLVFDGREGNYNETAAPNPLSVYAKTKFEAEQIVLSNPRHIVIRTSLNGGISPTRDRGFNEQMRMAWQRGEVSRLFTDEFRSPIAAECTARATWEIARQKAGGVFHVAGAERLSRFEIGRLFAAKWPALMPQIKPVSLNEYKGAPRSPDTSLDCSKAQCLLSFCLPRFSDWLRDEAPEGF